MFKEGEREFVEKEKGKRTVHRASVDMARPWKLIQQVVTQTLSGENIFALMKMHSDFGMKDADISYRICIHKIWEV